MKDKKRRITLGILAHVDAGKTTLSEALLYRTGSIRKPGRVDHGDTFLDDNAIERSRGITVFSRQADLCIKGGGISGEADGDLEVTLIDTPGHVDFAAETERSLSVLDYALVVISGSEGVQTHVKTLCGMLMKRGIPVFVFVNKMDISLRTRESLIDELRSELGIRAVDFTEASDRSEAFVDAVTLYSPSLAEAVLEAEASDYGAALSDGMIADSVAAGETVPCMFGSALRLEGIDELLDTVRRYVKEPEYREEFGARIYKTATADDGERLCFMKITGGELRVRDRVSLRRAGVSGEISADQELKIKQIRLYSGSRFVTADSAAAGAVCAVTGLTGALPGDSLGSEEPLTIDEVKPFMVYTVTGPEGKDPHEIMDDLMELSAEDPALSAAWSRDGSSMEIRLMGQVQLEVLQTLIKDRFGYEVSFGAGSVLYLETVNGTYEGVGHFEPLRHYAEVHLIMSPGSRGSGVVISSIVSGDELDINWQRLIMTHLKEREHPGVLTGAPLTDVEIRLAAGRAHDKHTVGGDFREATYRAVRNALMQALSEGNAALLEPWSEYEIRLPAQHLGRAMTDIRQMGGSQEELEQEGDTARIRGRVPSSGISDYLQILTGYTSGEGSLSLTPCGYDICHNSAEVIEASGYEPERDTDNPADSVFVSHSGSDIVRWDEVAEHMHIGSVLERMRRYEASGEGRETGTSGDRSGARERARRQAAAEKELREIFERTYGGPKERRRIDKRETDYRTGPELSDEEAERNAKRNEEIRAKHERRTAETEDKPVLVLVDGYNLIHADQYLRELAERDMGSARDQLTERLCNYAGYTGCELCLIFDAYRVEAGAGHEDEINGIRVIYTSENEPADIRMGVMTGSIKDRETYVVSSDMLLQQDAWTHGAMRISSHEFIRMLSRIEQEIRTRLRDGD